MSLEQSKVDNLLHISWCDSRWVPILNANNILDYFTERSNPFYSKECNNEFLKMQQNTRIDQLQHMQGTEYVLLHAQDPILYIIRKQHRYSPTQINPLSCYHIIAGQVFQTPDLGSVINSRLVTSINHINSAFTELHSFSQYHPSKGYWWQTPKQSQESTETQKKNADKKVTRKEEVASLFQRRRVDLLLSDLAVKFPYKLPHQQQQTQQAQQTQQTQQQQSQPQTQQMQSQQQQSLQQQSTTPQPSQTQQQPPTNQPSESIKQEEKVSETLKTDVKVEVKTEPKLETTTQPPPPTQRAAKPPPEKRQKLGP